MPDLRSSQLLAVTIATNLILLLCPSIGSAAIQYFLQGNWPADRRAAAIDAMNRAVDRFNQHGGFDHVLNVYYEPGVPTADGNINGTIRFGGTWPNERVALHEIAHTLGVGTTWQWGANMPGGAWTGPRALERVRLFDGLQAGLNGDSAHFWPYGLNFDNEGGDLNSERQVALVYAMRADMGIGPTGSPFPATSVSLTASNPGGTSGFNYPYEWSDGQFPHAGASYTTGNFSLRTPETANSYTFPGDSVRLNVNAPETGLRFKGIGTQAVITFPNVILDGGWIDHRMAAGDLFQLDGTVNVQSSSTIRAKQGNIRILADVHGNGTLNIPATDFTTVDDGYVTLASPGNTFSGNVVVAGRYELASTGTQRFVIGASGVNNTISGANARRVRLSGAFDIDVSGASPNPGDSWALVTASNAVHGSNFRVNAFVEHSPGVWSNEDGYAYSESTRLLTVVPEVPTIAYTNFDEPAIGDFNFVPGPDDEELGFQTVSTPTSGGVNPYQGVRESLTSADSPVFSQRSLDATTTFDFVDLSMNEGVTVWADVRLSDSVFEANDFVRLLVTDGTNQIVLLDASGDELNALNEIATLTYRTYSAIIPDSWSRAQLICQSRTDSGAGVEQFDLDNVAFQGWSTNVPEPSTFALLAVAGLLSYRRRVVTKCS